jgi:predicted phage terminase large subunit-like protein
MTETLDINKVKIAKVKCLRSLLFHYRYFFKAQQKMKAVIGDHHLIIADALERVLRGELLRLIINIGPRYNKTELAVIQLISNGLALNPSAKFIHLSYADDLALDNSEKVKQIVQSEEYQQLFPKVQIKKDSRAKDKWYTTEGGGVLARAAGGQVTGFGAGKPDEQEEDKDMDEFIAGMEQQKAETKLDKKFRFNGCIVIDDPLKPIEADSDTIRERVNERYDSTIKNRVNSRKTPIIVIMQRLHPNDLSGYLMNDKRKEKWEVISLPAIKSDGTALWPYKHTVEELMDMKHDNELVFERQYMQNPQPKTGLMFPIQELHFFNYAQMEKSLNDPDHNYICADPSDSGGDFFAAMDSRLIGDKIYIVDVIFNTLGADHNESALVNLVLRTRANNVGIESVFGWKETAKKVRDELIEKGFGGEVKMLHPRTGKLARISNRSSFMKNNFVFRDDYEERPEYAAFIRNYTSYLKIQEPGRMNKHDDSVDCGEMCGAYYEKNFPSLWPVKL